MDKTIQTYFDNLNATDKEVQYEAYNQMLSAVEEQVDWAYEVWDQLKIELTDKDNHKRSRAAQFLAHLAISDPEKRILMDFPAIWGLTYDKKFVTARHSLQSVWRICLAGSEQKEMVLKYLIDRFQNCTNEKNYTLIRFDIITGLRNLYNELQEDEIRQIAMDLINIEADNKYEKKYLGVWK
jgi:hypothetical protein